MKSSEGGKEMASIDEATAQALLEMDPKFNALIKSDNEEVDRLTISIKKQPDGTYGLLLDVNEQGHQPVVNRYMTADSAVEALELVSKIQEYINNNDFSVDVHGGRNLTIGDLPLLETREYFQAIQESTQ